MEAFISVQEPERERRLKNKKKRKWMTQMIRGKETEKS